MAVSTVPKVQEARTKLKRPQRGQNMWLIPHSQSHHPTATLGCHLWALDLLGDLNQLCSSPPFLGNQMTPASEEAQRVSSLL